MINNFKTVGNTILTRDGYYDTDDTIKKRKKFLYHLSLKPFKKDNTIDRAIALNFDLVKNEFYFELDKELREDNREYFFAFKVGAPRDTKKFLSTNNIESLLSRTIPDSLPYLTGKRKDKKSALWFDENVSKNYDLFLEKLRDTFFEKDGDDTIIALNKMAPHQKEALLKIKQTLEENKKDNKPIPLAKLITSFLKEKYRDGDRKELPSLYMIKINGKHIMEMEEYGEAYINIVYYDLFQRFFIEDIKKDKNCHVCGEKKDVTNQNPLPMKFYGLTNNLYFENTDNKNAYKALSVCRDCMTGVLAGMKYTESVLRHSIFGMNSYIVPTMTENDPQFEAKLKKTVRLLLGTRGHTSATTEIQELKQLIKKTGKKNFKFNMMFYVSDKQSFDILKYIPDIQLKGLMDKMALFESLSAQYRLSQLEHCHSLQLTDIRYYLYPSKYSHNKADFKIYAKELMNFLDNFLNEYNINYNDMIARFTDIYRRRFFIIPNKSDKQRNPKRGDCVDIYSPFKMVMFLTILHRLKILKEGKQMRQGNFVSTVLNDSYKEFFNTHREVYDEHNYRQGLFLLGTVISKIVRKQRTKNNDKDSGKKMKLTSTFMKKINFDGIPARRVMALIAEVKDYSNIYDVYEEKGLWGNIMDRLQGIENSGMKGDEIVFYILTGVSFADYLGAKFAMDKKQETN